MIKSMTGYGAAKMTIEGCNITVELRSVNNRYLESSIRLPRNLLFIEDNLKSIVKDNINRGKVDVFVNVDCVNLNTYDISVNEALADSYFEAFLFLSKKYEIPFDISATALGRLPDVLSVQKKDDDFSEITVSICQTLKSAISDFNIMREKEGEKLKNDILEKVGNVSDLVDIIESTSSETVNEYRLRLEAKMRELLSDYSVDENRIITETAIFADHIAIDEEIVRLRSHISQLIDMLSQTAPVGRKLDFLIQEFNREANTIGSKSQNSKVAHYVVDLKSEIEKIREQIQNIE